jgi:hypothetical protein
MQPTTARPSISARITRSTKPRAKQVRSLPILSSSLSLFCLLCVRTPLTFCCVCVAAKREKRRLLRLTERPLLINELPHVKAVCKALGLDSSEVIGVRSCTDKSFLLPAGWGDRQACLESVLRVVHEFIDANPVFVWLLALLPFGEYTAYLHAVIEIRSGEHAGEFACVTKDDTYPLKPEMLAMVRCKIGNLSPRELLHVANMQNADGVKYVCFRLGKLCTFFTHKMILATTENKNETDLIKTGGTPEELTSVGVPSKDATALAAKLGKKTVADPDGLFSGVLRTKNMFDEDSKDRHVRELVSLADAEPVLLGLVRCKDGEGPKCAFCGHCRPKGFFSSSQKKKSASTRRCTLCPAPCE